MIFLVSEADFADPATVNGREWRAITDAARMMGCRVVPLPPDLHEAGGADAVFAYVSAGPSPAAAVWAGYIPSAARYQEVYEGLAAKGVRLINTPEQHFRAMDFDGFYERLRDHTPESRTAATVEESIRAAAELGYPVFVKGAIKSSKEQGWNACVANDVSGVERIASFLLSREKRARGRIIIRRFADLRRTGETPGDFPLSREYRIFLLNGEVVSAGYYWEGTQDPWPLTAADEGAMYALAQKAAALLEVPFVAVDIGQLNSGEWIVIETGDAQFCGLSQASLLGIWNRLSSEPSTATP